MLETQFFALGEGYHKSLEFADRIKNKINGRVSMDLHDYGLLGQAIWNVEGFGGHLDIGTLYGGSAILAALIKKNKFHGGPVVCIDIFEDYYGGGKDPLTPDIPVSVDTLMENARMFDVSDQIIVVPGKSYPLPEVARDPGFGYGTVLIDGDHNAPTPLNDFYSAKRLSPRYILLHDYRAKCPGVVEACRAAAAYSDLQIAHVSGITFIVERKDEPDFVGAPQAVEITEAIKTPALEGASA